MRIRVDSLDKLFSEFIRKRAGGKCEYCGQHKQLQCSHFIGRRKRNTRFDPENCVGLCFDCHIYLGEHPYQHTEFMKKRLGSERFEALIIRGETIARHSIKDKEAIKAQLKEWIKLVGE